MVKKLLIDLKPISINKCWQGRRFKTPEYKAWRETAAWILKSQKPKKMIGWCDIEIDFFIKRYTTMDVDNGIKPTLDSLVDARIIKDDRFVNKITVTKHKSENERILIKIIPH